MPDNFPYTPGTGGLGASRDVGGADHPKVLPIWGPPGQAIETDVASGKPLPTQLRTHTGLIPLGEPTDARSTATDVTSAGLIAIAKQLSYSLQQLETLMGWTATATIILVNAASTTSAATAWAGYEGLWQVEGDFTGGGSWKMQWRRTASFAWWDVPDTSVTANGMMPFTMPPGEIRAVKTGTTGNVTAVVQRTR